MAQEQEGVEGWLVVSPGARGLVEGDSTKQEYRVSGTGPDFFKAGPGRNARVLYKRSDLEAWMAKFKFQSTSEYKK